MRLFIAIDFNELNDYFVELQSHFPKNGRLSLTKTFHLTLKFLGEVQPHIADRVIESLKKIDFGQFSVQLGSIGVFPTDTYIRVVWVGLQPEGRIMELQKQIDDALENLFKKEKDFKVHITLARVKYLEDNKSFLEQIKRIKVDSKKVEVKSFMLMKSTLTPDGPAYGQVEMFC